MTGPQGIALSDARGDVTNRIGLYDAGTEVDEEIDIGPNVAPQQPAQNTGPADPDARVRMVTPAIYAVPTSAHLRVTIE